MGIKLLEEKMAAKTSRIVLKADSIYKNTMPISDACNADAENIKRLHNIAAAVLINPIYYWMCGIEGQKLFDQICSCARNLGLYIIYELGTVPDDKGVHMLFKGMGYCDAVILSAFMDEAALQSAVFEINRGARMAFLSVKNAEADYALIGEMARQAAPVSGYSNIGIFTGESVDNKLLRQRLPECFFLCDECANPKIIKSCFGRDGKGAAVCTSAEKTYEELNRFRIRLEKMSRRVMDDSFIV